MLQPFARPALPSRGSRHASARAKVWLALGLLAGLGLGGCAQQPQQMAAAGHPKEYFPSSIYGPASRRVIADGEPVPRGGGQYLVGKPYTIAGQTYYPSERRVTQVGLASWYGDAFHGRLTANGEIYDRDSFTAAHPTMPLPSYARVTNLRNNASMIVRVNDRGPYHSNRVMDVSRRVAEALDIRRYGTAKVKVEWVARASLAGSDDARLASTLRTDGPARIDGVEGGTLLAAVAGVPTRVAALGNAFLPAPIRPAPIVEEQRPDKLEAYRAAPPARRPRVEPREDDSDEAVERHASRPRLAAPVHEIDADDDAPTASLPRSRRAAAPAPRAIRLDAQPVPVGHDGGAKARSKARDDRGSRIERAAAPQRHVATAMRAVAPMPPARVAAVFPPARPPHAVHATRSRGG